MKRTRTHQKPTDSHASRPFFSNRSRTSEATPFFSVSSRPVAQVQPKREVDAPQELEEVQTQAHDAELESAQHAAGEAPLPPADSNAGVQVQTKLAIGQPNDRYEQEANQVADQIMRMPAPKIQRLCPECEEELQRQPMAEEEKKKEEETLQTQPLGNNLPDDQATDQIQRSPLPGFSFGKLESAPKERLGIQAKLAIGQPGDKYEQEADQVAEQVMRMPAPDSLSRGPLVNSNLPLVAHPLPVQKQEVKEEDEEKNKGKIQAKEEFGQTPRVTAELEQQLQASQGKGQPLPEETRSFMKSRFGQDFNQVRVHADGEAAQMNRALNAQAFTHRQDVYFGADKYSPQLVEGQRLLAHELTHVVQQTGRIQTSLVARQLNQTILQREEEKGSAGNQGAVREITDKGSEATRGTKTIKAKPPLPPGNWEIIGYDALVRVSWLVEDGWSRQAGDNFKLPTVIETLVRDGVKKLGFNWVTDEAIAQKLPDIVISLPAIEEDDEVIEINLINLFKFFGPPDDMQVYWVPQGDGMLLVLRAETLQSTPIAARESGVMTIRDAAFNQRILAQLEARTGLTARTEHRAAFLSRGFPVNPNDLAGNGVLLPYSREMFDFLFGKDTWDTWLKNQKQGKKGGKIGKDGEKKGGKPGGITGGVAGGKTGGNEEALKRLQSVYEFLIASFPEQLKDKTFEDFVNYLRSHADLVKAKADTPWPKLDDPEIWRSFADAWAEGRKLPPEALSTQADSWLQPGYVFKPNGEIVISPEIEDYRYITGAEIEVRMEMRSPPAENLLVNAFPRKANFRWHWSGEAGGLTGLVGGLGDASGNNERSVKLKKRGVYTLSVDTSSIYFRGGEILTRSQIITVVDPGERMDEVFGERTGSGDKPHGPFERAPDDSLRLRASLAGGVGEQAMSFEARKKALLDQISRIEALVNDGKITRADAKEAIDLINDQIKKIEEFKVKAGPAGRAYVVDGVFLSEDSSSYFPLKLSMYGTVIRDDDKLTYQILIADLTSLGGAPRYLDSASGSAGGDEAATRAQLEQQAIKNACEEFRKANAYPDGRVRLAIQLHDGTGVFTHNFTTRSGRKDVKKYVGYGGMAVGGVGIVLGAIFTEGATTPAWVKVIMASAVLAGVAEVGLNVEQRIRTGQLGDKWTVEAVDVAMVATSVMGLRALASAKPVAGGFQVAMKWGDRSLVGFLSISVKAEIDAADAECTAQIAAGVDRTKAEAERNQKVAAILEGAAINGGFMLFAHMAQAHGSRVGAEERGVSRRNVRQEIAELAATGTPEQIKSKVMESKLSADERALLTEALATASERKSVAESSKRKPQVEPEPQPSRPVEPGTASEPATPSGKRNLPGKTETKPIEPATPSSKGPMPEDAPTLVREQGTLEPHVDKYPEGLVHLELTGPEAHASYQQSIRSDPTREVAIYIDPATGEHIVVQGNHDFVDTGWFNEPGMQRIWKLVEHYHPGPPTAARYASINDFMALMQNLLSGHAPVEAISTAIRWHDPVSKLQFVTEIGYVSGSDQPYWIKYRDAKGKWQFRTFKDTPWNAGSDYIRFLQAEGVPQATVPPKESGKVAPTAPVAPASASQAKLPTFNRNQRARIADIEAELVKHDMTWTDLGFRDSNDVARFFVEHGQVDTGIKALEQRLREKLRLRAEMAQAQHPEEWQSREPGVSEQPSREVPEVPEGQRLPRGTETTDAEYGGFWSGERGNSDWYSDVRALNEVTGYKPIRFRKGFADFRPWALERIFMKITGIDTIDFAVADAALAKRRGFKNQTAYENYRTAKRLTWHHVEGAEEMILVPRDVHENVPHVGGASEAQSASGSGQ